MSISLRMISQQLRARFFSSSLSRCFSRLSSVGPRQRRRLPQTFDLQSLGLEPMEAELSYLWQLRTNYADSDVRASLLNDNSFRSACIVIMKKLRYMRPEQIRSLVHLVFSINLPSNLGISKGALQMLRVHLNEYDARQLSEVYLLLEKNKTVERDVDDEINPSNPILEALLVAIPKALEITIIGKKLILNSNSLLLILKASTTGLIDIKAIRFLLQVIVNKLKFMDAAHLNDLIGLLSHPHIESNLDLIDRSLINRILNHCWNRLTNSISNQNFEIDYYFEKTLKSLSKTKDPIYYNRKYCDVIYRIYEKSDSFENLNAFDDFLAFTMKYDHYSINALEKIFSLIVSSPNSFMSDTPLSSANIVKILGNLNWKPNNVDWKQLFPLLQEDLKLIGSDFYTPMETLISFLILKEYEVFEHFCETESNAIIENLDSNQETSLTYYNNLLTFNIGVRCEVDNLTSETIKSILSVNTPTAINYLNSIYKPDKFQQSLSAFLLLVCGQHKMLTDVWTSYGHFINNLIAIDKNGKPVEFGKSIDGNQTRIKFLEDYSIDSENKLIAVLPLTDSEYNATPYTLKGQFDLKFRTLEDVYGIKILKIHLDTWECLSDREKCAFLLRELSETIGQQLDKELVDRVNCY